MTDTAVRLLLAWCRFDSGRVGGDNPSRTFVNLLACTFISR
jgi:hypothetical protein